MEIRLRPELEALVLEDVERGAYQTVNEYIEHAVWILHEQEVWLAANCFQIAAKIEEGYKAAQRGELLDLKEVRSRLCDLKRELKCTRQQSTLPYRGKVMRSEYEFR